jgi:glycosyltransferase involved in cell wall biosynthesis
VRILFLAPRHPYPVERGDQRRVFHLVEELSRRVDVTLIAFGEGQLPCPGVRVIGVPRRFLPLVAGNLRVLDPRMPLQTRLHLSAAMSRAVAEEIRRDPPDVIHATLARMAPFLPPPGTWHRHLDLVDALSLNMAARARSSRGAARLAFGLEARLMRSYEAACVADCESSSLVSEADRQRAAGLEFATVVPNGVDLAQFPFAEPLDRPARLIFFGNLGYYHNVEPARFVAQEVLPRVRRRVPDATLCLVGARPAAAVLRLADIKGVQVVGAVPDMALELHRAAVAIIPIFSGSGMKNKILEAFSVGTPVVTNAAGIGGIEGTLAGRHYLEGETADALADCCSELLSDPVRRVELAHAGRALVERDYTWSAQVERLLAIYARGRLDA